MGIAPRSAFVVGLEQLWAHTRGDARVCVAVLDGPVDRSHPSLAGAQLAPLATLVGDTGGAGAAARHGTHVASVIFAQHNGALRGIAPGCRGLIVPIFESRAGGAMLPCSQIDLARALLAAVNHGAHVINVSGGEFSPSGRAHPILADAVAYCAKRGALIVAAAGNEGCDCLHLPGAMPGVLAVGAMDAQGRPLESSNWGGAYRTQGILACGQDVVGAVPDGGVATASGTSFAAPIVSGVAALLLSLQLEHGMRPDPAGVRAALLATAVGCEREPIADCRRLLGGRLNLPAAMQLILSGGLEMSESLEHHDTPQASRVEVAHAETAGREESVAARAEVAGVSPSCPPPASVHPTDPQACATSEEVPREVAGVHVAGSASQKPGSAQGYSRDDAGPSRASRWAVGSEPTGRAPESADAAGQGVAASECPACAAAKAAPLVYAIGQLGYDFGTEARRDSFAQAMGRSASPHDPRQLLAYLSSNPWDCASVIWTLNQDAVAMYGIQANGPFADRIGHRLCQFLEEQLSEGVERISVPGRIVGVARLLNGQTVPVIQPELRGMCSWTTAALVGALVGRPPARNAGQRTKDQYAAKASGIANFLERVYHEHRNLGITPEERAMNFAATNAFNIERVYESAKKEDMELDTIEVERSPVCRPESDCWEVKLLFFYPERQVQTVRRAFRFTVDVSDVVPVTVGPVRSWYVR